jgi:hypothetical protein
MPTIEIKNLHASTSIDQQAFPATLSIEELAALCGGVWVEPVSQPVFQWLASYVLRNQWNIQ